MTGDDSKLPGLIPTGAVPDYVPPHLRGKVWDFRNEADGSVSFAHPEAALGLSPEQSRVKLSPDQYNQTFSRTHRFHDFSKSMRSQYAPMHRKAMGMGQSLNEGIAEYLRNAIGWGTSSAGKSVGLVGLLSALGGVAGSYALDRYQDRPGSIGRALTMALLSGAAGAGATAYGQQRHKARENMIAKSASADIATALVRLLEGDPTLGSYDRAAILRALVGTPDRTKDELLQLMKTAGGVGAGMIAMRFLGGKGLLPMMVGGIMGGALARPKPDRNALGQLSMTNYL